MKTTPPNKILMNLPKKLRWPNTTSTNLCILSCEGEFPSNFLTSFFMTCHPLTFLDTHCQSLTHIVIPWHSSTLTLKLPCHILCKYCAKIVQILYKYCAYIVQILWKYLIYIGQILGKYGANIMQYWVKIVKILCMYCVYIVQIVCKYWANIVKIFWK